MNSVIVIGREFGSGGREIARRLAESLGHKYYDRELLSEAAERCGFSPDLFATRDEKRPSALRSLLHFGYGISDTYTNGGMSSEEIYKTQSGVIRSLAEENSCVFVGRTADYVLRNHPHILSVFIHAPLEERVKRIMARGECSDPRQAAELARRMDRKRRDYYNYFTGREWGVSSNYDLSIDSSRFPLPRILELLTSLHSSLGKENPEGEIRLPQ